MYYKHPVLNAFLALLLCISFLIPVGYTDAATSSAKIINITGDVQVMRAGGDKSFSAFVNMRLTEGDRILTGRAATAKVEIDSERVITLAENTRIYLSELRGNDDSLQSSISLQSGGVGSNIKNALTNTSRFEIKTPTAVMGVRGTEFFTSYNNGEIDVRVITGAVNVTASLSGGSSTPPAPPAPDGPPGGFQPGDTGQPPAPPTRPVRPPAPPPPPPYAPGAPDAPGGTVSFIIGAMQQARFSEQSTPEELLAPPAPLNLEGLDVAFIDRVAEIAQSTPAIIPANIFSQIPEARQQAEDRRQQQSNNPNVAPDEFAAPTGERQIVQSLPSMFAPPAPPPPPEPEPISPASGTSGDDSGGSATPTLPNVQFDIYLHEVLVGSSLHVSHVEQHPSTIYLDSSITGIIYSNVSSSNTSVAAISMYETNNTYEISINGPGTTTISITGAAPNYTSVTKSFTLIVEQEVIDLSGVSYNVREGKLIGTCSDMQYQIASGGWLDAGTGETDNVSFEPGTVKVRQTNYSSNERLLGTIAVPATAPTVGSTNETGIEQNDGTITGFAQTMQYKLHSDTEWITFMETINTVENLAPGTYNVRTAATETTLPSLIATLTIEAFFSIINATVATVDSHYIVNNFENTVAADETIINTNVTVETFLSNLTKHAQAEWKVVTDVTTVNNAAEFDIAIGKESLALLLFGDKLLVKAEDGSIKAYVISVVLGDPVLGGGPHPGTPSNLKNAYSGFTWGLYRYWAYDFNDNRTAIQIVAYDQSNQIIQQWERSNGSCRYLTGITIDAMQSNILFHTSQGAGTITVPWSDLLLPQPPE